MTKGYVDSVVLALMPEVESGLAQAVGGPLRDGFATVDYLRKMDEAGVEISVLLASKGGSQELPGGRRFERWEVPAVGIAGILDQHPTRFRALIGVDPTSPNSSLAEVDEFMAHPGFVGLHIYPHWWGKPPDDRIYYPFYEKACALDVPIQIQIGSSLVPFLRSVARPLTLEQVAIDFPELKLIGSHTGWPWVDEMVAVMQNHANVYVTTSCHYPMTDWSNPVTGLRPLPRWDDALIRFCNLGTNIDLTPGAQRVLFGSDFPEWEYSIMIEEGRQVLTPDVFTEVFRDAAARLFGLDESNESANERG